MNKGVLGFSLTIGLLFHVGGIGWLYYFPVSIPNSLKAYLSQNVEENNIDLTQKQHRTELLSEIFDHIIEEEHLLKEVVHELKTENAPQLAIQFPIQMPPEAQHAEFSFTSCSLSETFQETTPFGDEGRSGISLIAPLSADIPRSAPPLADFWNDQTLHDDAGVVAGSQHFDVHVEYAPKRFRPGYVFKVTFLPKADVPFKRIRQNFFFLLDRSNSMPRARYAFNKQAVAEALSFLKPGDRFNILIFDNHVVRFQDDLIEWTDSSYSQALRFLDQQGHGGVFAVTDLYTSLEKIVPQNVAEDEVNTAILLSDGDTYLTKEKQRVMIGGWTQRNLGKVALYTITSGTGNNTTLLELLSSFNKGTLVYAYEHVDVKERLGHLMRTIQNPIGTRMVATAVAEEPSMLINLQPKTARIPDLYQNRPFVIYGSTNKLSNFILFLQGHYYNTRFDIKKKISLKDALLVPFTIERGWTQLIAQEFYERYFKEGSSFYLEEAKNLLSPLNLPTPFIEQ